MLEVIGGVAVAAASLLGALGSLRLTSRQRVHASIEGATKLLVGLPDDLQTGPAGDALRASIRKDAERLRDRNAYHDFVIPALGVSIALTTGIAMGYVLAYLAGSPDELVSAVGIALGAMAAVTFALGIWARLERTTR